MKNWPEYKSIDLGCGFVKREGFFGVDVVETPQTDAVWDLTQTPWPIGDGRVKELYCHHTLEHFTWPDVVKVMNEAYRVLQAGGLFEIIVPLFPSDTAVDDPDHKTFFSKEAFGRFEPENEFAYEVGIINKWRRIKNDWTPSVIPTETSAGTQLLFPDRRELHVVLKKGEE